MAKFQSTSKRNPCIVCNNNDGDCRTIDKLILCQKLDDQVKGYKNLGHTKDGLWTQYIIDDKSSEFDRKAHKQRIAKIKKENEKARLLRLKNSLSSSDRNKYIRKISNYLGLLTKHKEDLKNRGLNEDDIKEGLFFSLDKGYNPIPSDISLSFPNVSKDFNGHKQIYSGVDGYACIAFDNLGRAIALQIRDENKKADNKYRWLKNSHLKNGELPITVLKPLSNKEYNQRHLIPKNSYFINNKGEGVQKKTLYNLVISQVNENNEINQNTALLAEGISPKPYIVNKKFNCLTIGVAGGLFSNSKKQFLEAVREFNIQSVILCPDAGDLINKQVRRRWSRQIKWLRKQGLTINIAWWGQFSKEDHLDIDEIEDLSQVTLITPDEFFKLNTYYHSAKKKWRKSKKFTPDTIINQQYLDIKKPDRNTITAIKSALGTGKTTNSIKWIKELRKEKIIYLQYRNSLNVGFVKKVNQEIGEDFIKYINDSDFIPRYRGGQLWNLALCLDSLWKLDDDDFDDCILILDEIISIIKYLQFSSTLNNSREKIKKKIEQAIKRAKRVILLDGNLTNWAVDYISSIDKTKEIIKIENTFKPKKQTVFYLNGEVKEDGTIKQNSRTNWINKILTKIQENVRSGICSDSQVFLESMERLALRDFPDIKTLRVDSKTKGEEGFIEIYINGKKKTINEVELFLMNPDDYLKKNDIDLLLYSPTCESGVDISIKNYFTSHFCFFFGVLDVDSILQMIKRIRDDIPRYIWIRSWSSNNKPLAINSPFADTIAKQIKQTLNIELSDIASFNFGNNKDKIKAYFNQLIDNSYDNHFEIANYIKAFQNFEKANLRDCVRERLIATDYDLYDIEDLFVIDETRKDFNQISETVKIQNCSDIIEAEYLPVETNTDKISKGDLPWKRLDRNEEKPDRVGITNLYYRQKLPEIENSEFWDVDLINKLKYQDRNLLEKLELFYLYNNQEIMDNMRKQQYFNLLKKEKVSLHQLRLRHRFINALNKINFSSLYQLVYKNDSPQILKIYNQIKHDLQLQSDLKLNLGKSTPCEFIGRLAKKLGIKTHSSKINEIRHYSFILPNQDSLSKILLECIERRLDKFSERNFEVNFEEIILNNQVENRENSQKIVEAVEVEEKIVKPLHDNTFSQRHLTPKNSYFIKHKDEGVREKTLYNLVINQEEKNNQLDTPIKKTSLPRHLQPEVKEGEVVVYHGEVFKIKQILNNSLIVLSNGLEIASDKIVKFVQKIHAHLKGATPYLKF